MRDTTPAVKLADLKETILRKTIREAWLEVMPWVPSGKHNPCLGVVGTSHIRVALTLALTANSRLNPTPAQLADLMDLLCDARSEPVVYWPQIQFEDVHQTIG